MKKAVAVILVLLLLLGITTAYGAAPGSSADPLMSLSYINSTFFPALDSASKTQAASAMSSTYSAADSALKTAYDSYVARLSGTAASGYQFAAALTPLDVAAGAIITLRTGGTLILTAGTATVSVQTGTMINISTGELVSSGAALVQSQRYFCAEDTTAVFTAVSQAACLVDGSYVFTGGSSSNGTPFTDIRTTDWYFKAVRYVTGKSLFSGTSSTTFSPQTAMTRGMFVTVLYRLSGTPAVTTPSTFADVADTTKYYYNAVVWANAKKVVSGYSDGKYHPDDAITREQMAVIISRYAASAGYSTTPVNTGSYDAFSDTAAVSQYAIDALKWASGTSLISGANGKLSPKDTASRAQVAQIILNFCSKIMGQ